MVAAIAVIVSIPGARGETGPPGPKAVAARVGGEPIYLGEIIEGVSSLALVGQEHAGERLGSRERLLERLVTARLLYLDGRDRQLDASPRYVEDLRAFTDPILAARYLEHLRDAAGFHRIENAALTPNEHRQRRQVADTRFDEIRKREVERLRNTTRVTLLPKDIDPSGDRSRGELTPVATIRNSPLTWRRAAPALAPLPTLRQRTKRLEALVATSLLADEARQLKLDGEPGFQRMVDGFHRREIIKLVREQIIDREGLDDTAVEREYRRHIANFTFPEQRRVQQIVVPTRAEAEELSTLLASPPPGVSFYTLARDRSVDPSARQTLGVLGWVSRAQGSPPLSKAAFSLEPGEISAPIETDAGFHIVRVLSIRPEEIVPLDADTSQRIRDRWNANRIQEYANRLAAKRYRVELFPEVYQPRPPARNGGTDS